MLRKSKTKQKKQSGSLKEGRSDSPAPSDGGQWQTAQTLHWQPFTVALTTFLWVFPLFFVSLWVGFNIDFSWTRMYYTDISNIS